MHSFFNKHMNKLDDCTAVKMVLNEIERAYKDLEKGETEFVHEHLGCAFEMLEDYFQVKGVGPKEFHLSNLPEHETKEQQSEEAIGFAKYNRYPYIPYRSSRR